MPPLTKAARRSRGRSLSTDEGLGIQQHGRSSTGLAASAAAAALRNFAKGRSPTSNRSSASSNSKDSFKSLQNDPLAAKDFEDLRPLPHRRSTTPTWPSPIISSKSSESIESPSAASGSASSEGNRPAATTLVHPSNHVKSPAAHSTRPIPPPPPPPRRSRTRPADNTTARQHSSKSASRSETPMTLSDLGRDYSRYPFRSRRSSFSAPSTPAPQYSGVAGTSATREPLITRSAKEEPSATITNVGYTVDPEKRSSWFLDDRIGAPGTADAGYNFPLYLDEKELDDDMHMPQPDDDVRLKPKLGDYFAPQQLCSLFGLIFMLIGLLAVFILLPVLSYSGHAIYSYPYNTPSHNDTEVAVQPWEQVNTLKYPLLQNIRTGLIDPNTPKSAITRQSFLGETLQLVFSDEFNQPNRTFYQGDDPFWTAQDLWYAPFLSHFFPFPTIF